MKICIPFNWASNCGTQKQYVAIFWRNLLFVRHCAIKLKYEFGYIPFICGRNSYFWTNRVSGSNKSSQVCKCNESSNDGNTICNTSAFRYNLVSIVLNSLRALIVDRPWYNIGAYFVSCLVFCYLTNVIEN